MPSHVLTKTWEVEGVLTEPDESMKLSNLAGTFGVERSDTHAVIVADGTAMTQIAAGQYSYTVTTIAGVPYTAWIEVTYQGQKYYFEEDFTGAAAATTTLVLGYNEFRQETAHHVGWTRDSAKWDSDKLTSLERILQTALVRVYTPAPIEPGRPAHKWSFFYPVATLTTTAPYSTGTVTIAAGVVTLVGGTFPSWAASGDLTVDGVSYTVVTRDGGNQVTLDDTSVTKATASNYVLAQSAYDLPSDFGGFLGSMTYDPGISTLWPALQFASEAMIRERKQNDTTTARPRWYGIRPKPFVATTGQRWETILDPSPDGAYRLTYRYQVLPAMISEANPYPLGGQQLSETILEACLAVADERFNEGGNGLHQAKFMERLAAAIQLDQDRSTPDFMGYNADHSDDPDDDEWRTKQISPSLYCKYEGNIYY